MKKFAKVLVLCMVATLMVGCFGKKENQEKLIPTDESGKFVIADVEKDGIKLANIDISYVDGQSIVTGDVTNTTKADITLSILKLTALDKDSNVVATLTGYIGDNLKTTDNKVLNTSISDDLTKVTKIQLEVIK